MWFDDEPLGTRQANHRGPAWGTEIVNTRSRRPCLRYPGARRSLRACLSICFFRTEFLRRWGLTPGSPENHPAAVELLHDHFDRKRAVHASGDEGQYCEAVPPEYLSPVELKAWKALHATRKHSITDALQVYVEAQWLSRVALPPR